jgi:hypothetical protein
VAAIPDTDAESSRGEPRSSNPFVRLLIDRMPGVGGVSRAVH